MARPRKGLRVRLRPDSGVYEIVGHHPTTGEPVRISCRTRDEREAKVELAQFLAGLAKAPELAPAFRRPLLKDLLEQYASEMVDEDERRMNERKGLEAQGLMPAEEITPMISSPATLRQAVAHLIRHIGDVEPLHISTGLAKDYSERRRRDSWTIPGTNTTRHGVKDSTIRRELGVLISALTWAEAVDRDGWFDGREAPTFRHPVKAGNAKKPRWLTKTEIMLFLAAATTPHLRLFILLAVKTGARRSAITSLKWSAVDLNNRVIDFGPEVGNKRRPTQKMDVELYNALRAAYSVRITEWVLEWCGKPACDIKNAFRKAAVRAGFKKGYRVDKHGKVVPVSDVTPHDLKRTAISWMVQEGVDYQLIADYTETSVQTIVAHYGHLHPFAYKAIHKATKLDLPDLWFTQAEIKGLTEEDEAV